MPRSFRHFSPDAANHVARKPSSECVRQPAAGKQATNLRNLGGWFALQPKPEACGAGRHDDAALSSLGGVLLRFRSTSIHVSRKFVRSLLG